MMERTFVKVSSPSYESLGTAPTRPTHRPPEKSTARSTARAAAAIHARRGLPIIRNTSRDMVRARARRENRSLVYPYARAGASDFAGGFANHERARYGGSGGRGGDAGGDAAFGADREPC